MYCFKRFLCIVVGFGFTLSLYPMQKREFASRWGMVTDVVSHVVRPLASSMSYVKRHAMPISFVISGAVLAAVGYMRLQVGSLENALADSNRGRMDAENRFETIAEEALRTAQQLMSREVKQMREDLEAKDQEITREKQEAFEQGQRISELGLRTSLMCKLWYDSLGLLMDVKVGNRASADINLDNFVERASTSISVVAGLGVRKFLDRKSHEIAELEKKRQERGLPS